MFLIISLEFGLKTALILVFVVALGICPNYKILKITLGQVAHNS